MSWEGSLRRDSGGTDIHGGKLKNICPKEARKGTAL